jgi:hypothetical protein
LRISAALVEEVVDRRDIAAMEGELEKFEVFAGGYEGRSDGRVNLGERYGEIGISAVAAAVRYQGETRNAAYAREDHHGEAEQAS